MSLIGFGASPLGSVFGNVDQTTVDDAVHCAVDLGINLFDVSPYYGLTLAEERLGKALSGRRDRVFLATKCGRDGVNQFDFSARRVHASIAESLQRLRTDYVDLLQAHDVEFGDIRQIIEETVPALRDVQKAGKARFIGVTGFLPRMLQQIATQTAVDTVLSYCRYNLLVNDLDSGLSTFAEERRIGLITASPLHMGILTAKGPPPWHPAPQTVKDVGAAVVRLCRRQGLDEAVIAQRICLNHPTVASTLIGMASRTEVEKNLQALTVGIPPALLVQIQELVEPVHNLTWPSGLPVNDAVFGTSQTHEGASACRQ